MTENPNAGILNRRSFCAAAGAAAGVAILPLPPARADAALEHTILHAAIQYRGRTLPPIYVVAYVEPSTGQEGVVARYPLAIVPQNHAPEYMRWRDKIKALNPSIVMLAYQMTSLEPNSSGRGPGHNLMAQIQSSWVSRVDGVHVKVETPPRRVYDLRRDEWKQTFLEACDLTLASYPFDGLFLDQCSVFSAHSMLESTRSEMRAHLQEVILELRRRHPQAILIGNSAYKWRGLNGEMSEDRLQYLDKDFSIFEHSHIPRMRLGLVLIKQQMDIDTFVHDSLLKVCGHGAMFTAAWNFKHAPWFPIYDRVIDIVARRIHAEQ